MSGALSRDHALRLLCTVTVGRVFVHHHALPVVLPVSFRLINAAVVMPVLPGGRIAVAAERREVMAFEADYLDPDSRVGWSVVVTGVATPIAEHAHVAVASASWAPQGRTTLLQLPVTDVIGRVGSVVWA
jgi:hypothetical protein